MKDFRPLNFVLTICCLLMMKQEAKAQDQPFEIPTTNTRAKIQQRVAATDVEVTYNRPGMKGRKIFGELIPYGQVWRTGSDASTKISFSTPVILQGKPLGAGTYELFTIPGKSEWTIILQASRNQWGSYAYNPEFDALRVTANPQPLKSSVETFTIGFDNVTSKSATLSLAWENVMVPVVVEVDLQATVVPLMEENLARADAKKYYFRAAMFYFENDLDINRAAELMNLAVKENPNHLGMLYRLGLILEKKGDRAGAIAASEKSLTEARKASKELSEEYIKLNTALLARLKELDVCR